MEVVLKDSVETRMLIAKTGESLRSFSKKIDISQGYLSQILTMKRNPSAKVAYKIAQGLNIEIESIFLIKMNDISIRQAKEGELI